MKIWVTRDEEPGGPLSAALEAAGLEPILEPVITRRVLTEARAEIASLGPDDWLVLTSVYAIEAAAQDAARIPRVAVVGEASRKKAEELGLRVELVSAEGSGRDLFARLSDLARGMKVCYPRSSLADMPELPDDVELISPVLYETVASDYRRGIANEVDAAAVASPSAVRAMGKVDLRLASIGPTTSAAIRELGMEPWLEAPQPSFDALARAIADQARSSRNQRA
ncbi:MAG: uroporphyrinogen-III synthase [Phycisphaerales bacterium]|nr:MAG: uroporphyrinogen-III synthase [Phycisphaerales bacterium]